MAYSTSFFHSSKHAAVIKKKHNRDAHRLLCIFDEGLSRHKNRKIKCPQSCYKGKLIKFSNDKTKRYCQSKQSSSLPFIWEKSYLDKHSMKEDAKMDSELSEITRDALSTEGGKMVDSGNVEEDTFICLEWQSLCTQVAQYTSTSMCYLLAKEGCFPIGSDLHDSEELLDQTAAALSLPDALDFSGIQDIRKIIKSAVLGEACTVNELCAVKRTLQSARIIYDKLCSYASEMNVSVNGNSTRIKSQDMKELDPLFKIFEGADFCTNLENELDHCLDCAFLSVLDRASPALASVRSNRGSNMEAIETLIKETAKRIAEVGGIDSPLVTKRRSRLCVGIRAAKKSLLPGGIVLDVSSSGATYFMEPKDALYLNNMEVQLAAAERSEECAILGRLVSRIASESTKIINVLERVIVIDLACARADHARWQGAVRPFFTQKEHITGSSILGTEMNTEINETQCSFVDIEGIQHPILLEHALQKPSSKFSSLRHSSTQKHDASYGGSRNVETVQSSDDNKVKLPVPIDIKIGPQKRVVIISGPNAGGKTATMKTLGLAAIMAKAGIFLAAKGQPRLPWFDHIMADIGDNQSLEQSLSTYSAHIKRLCKIMELGTRKSLVLIDEIGSGTDPSEGMALSASILQHLACHVNLTVVTTHYEDLTRLKDEDDRFENAAMEFDILALLPTYHILWGTTGQSNALDIAQSLEFDPNILSRAREWVKKLLPDRQQERQGGLFESLSKQRYELQDQARTVAAILSDATELYHELLGETEDLNEREVDLKLMEVDAVNKEITEAKYQIDEAIAKFEKKIYGENTDISEFMRKTQADIASIVGKYCSTAKEVLNSQTNTVQTNLPIPKIGDQVVVKRLGSKLATVAETPSKDDGSLLVQLGSMKFRVKASDIEKIVSSKEADTSGYVSVRQKKRRNIKSQKNVRQI
ncbi:uncharacterized protein LOC131032364 isoform X1 [Cryptomeria japonica]|uniref:uncharacterized protein LOC131032364 isoform X1 n=1 Tax=Cryptomeria japonica TaxID=3369 RepID=UPI0027DA4F5A|nr:uncharacterized protein LOC131032364 isoform X1 [Cryptomeria japonica]XP_057819292.2 uncharacterized protein LOC131032364 isoform X1 [Cryptomeria japonica]XP_057819293.2 uncharacterized protein LOC131032364 isoform X1 [Cryptomeria japonica]XP_059066023.1 uncharacterized protein LOC131032364 isoform X1 [Cryptomeria japonica]